MAKNFKPLNSTLIPGGKISTPPTPKQILEEQNRDANRARATSPAAPLPAVIEQNLPAAPDNRTPHQPSRG